MAVKVSGLDHLVLTVADLSATVAFYTDVLGMEMQRFRGTDGSNRWALRFGGPFGRPFPLRCPFAKTEYAEIRVWVRVCRGRPLRNRHALGQRT